MPGERRDHDQDPDPPDADAVLTDLDTTLDRVDAALHRLDEGNYGRCTHCGAELPDAVLEEDPTTATCSPPCAAV